MGEYMSIDLVGLQGIGNEYLKTLETLHGNVLYVALREREAMDVLREAYIGVRDEKLAHKNDAWLDRMKELMQEDVDSVRQKLEACTAIIEENQGTGQNWISMEVAEKKLRVLEEILRNRYGVTAVANEDKMVFKLTDGTIVSIIERHARTSV